jgi:hypothetical protein
MEVLVVEMAMELLHQLVVLWQVKEVVVVLETVQVQVTPVVAVAVQQVLEETLLLIQAVQQVMLALDYYPVYQAPQFIMQLEDQDQQDLEELAVQHQQEVLLLVRMAHRIQEMAVPAA